MPDGTKGIRLGQKFKKMGIRASHTGEVVLEDCRIPGRCLLGGKEKLDEGARARGQRAFATSGGHGHPARASRPAVGAQALGIARAAYEFALDYAKERKQFGRAIIDNQAIAFKLADMKMHIDASRLLIWRASWMAATRKPFLNGEGSMSKLYAGETVRVTKTRFKFSVATATSASTPLGGTDSRSPSSRGLPRSNDSSSLARFLASTSGSPSRKLAGFCDTPVIH